MTDLCSFCIAPLDVLKIRLQLQSHSLSDPLSTPPKSKRLPPSTVSTFNDIVRNEGITVWDSMLLGTDSTDSCRRFGRAMSPPSFSM